MAYEAPLFDWSFAVSVTFQQYRLAKLAATGVAPTTNLLAKAVGVLQQDATTGRTAAVRMFGISKVQAATGAIAIGDYLSASSGAYSTGTWKGGCVKKSTAPKTSYVVGIALTSAAAGGSKRIVSMALLHAGYATTA